MTCYQCLEGKAECVELHGFYLDWGKRILDCVLVVLLLPVWLPLCGLLWVLAWIETGSGCYVENRVGRDGQSFRCLKIRSMYKNTPRKCAAYKHFGDPRITPFGRILRRTSLDEIPQLWCVLKGEMSLVGPRPVPELELQRYGAQRGVYLQMRPGLTGLWQVSGRNALSYEQRIALDVRYRQTASIGIDLRIMGITLFEVFRGSGR